VSRLWKFVSVEDDNGSLLSWLPNISTLGDIGDLGSKAAAAVETYAYHKIAIRTALGFYINVLDGKTMLVSRGIVRGRDNQ
jgi:hypothetical protein